ncbi:hypothetical protein L7F22_057314 [Adiantum nelumboides]|nr:hypothetical protein [Adiantum nelumboides]
MKQEMVQSPQFKRIGPVPLQIFPYSFCDLRSFRSLDFTCKSRVFLQPSTSSTFNVFPVLASASKMVVWIFGYASLIWKAGFEYDERVVGFIRGYRRAFHLACFEHRGTLELPARVATLEQDEDAICWGVAYCIKGADAAERALRYLHVRECEYNTIGTFQFYTDSSDRVVIPDVQVFLSTNDSRYYLGGAPRQEIALQVAVASGPSGLNCDYLFRLVEALRDIGHEDMEVIELANAVRRFRNEMRMDGFNGLQRQIKNSSTTSTVTSTLSQSSVSVIPKLSTGIHVHGINSAPLNQMPRSPRLVKGRVS